jgi:dienelactone hydrolase
VPGPNRDCPYTPDAEPSRIIRRILASPVYFLVVSSLLATDSNNAASRDGGVAGVVAYYPLCYDGVDPSVRTLVLIGEKDDWTPAAKCQAVTDKTNFEVVVFPGATHVFNMPSEKPIDFLGHHFVYDEKATQDAQEHADAFMAAQKK